MRASKKEDSGNFSAAKEGKRKERKKERTITSLKFIFLLYTVFIIVVGLLSIPNNNKNKEINNDAYTAVIMQGAAVPSTAADVLKNNILAPTLPGALKSGVPILKDHIVDTRSVALSDPSNPWLVTMDKYNIPKNHASGVYVDLGGTATGDPQIPGVSAVDYRYASGRCPVYNKYIKLGTGNSYLERVPTEPNVGQDANSGSLGGGDPPGGGFQFPHVQGMDITPTTQSDIYACVKQASQLTYALHGPEQSNWPQRLKDQVNCRHNNQNWICIMQPFAYDMSTKQCYLLYFNWQKREGARNCDNVPGGPTMYCFEPLKDTTQMSLNMVYGTYNIPQNFMDICPGPPLQGTHFGTWVNNACNKTIAVETKADVSAAECAYYLFSVSSSDQPTSDSLVNLANAPHSNGVGKNWANYDEGTRKCEIFDKPPTCLMPASRGYALTSTGGSDMSHAITPDCNAQSEGWEVDTGCVPTSGGCGGGTQSIKKCTAGTWVITNKADCEVPCEGGLNPWVVAGPVLGVAALAAAGGGLYYMKKKGGGQPPAPKGPPQTDKGFEEAAEKKRQSDLMAEAEPSFWGGGDSRPTNVVLDAEY